MESGSAHGKISLKYATLGQFQAYSRIARLNAFKKAVAIGKSQVMPLLKLQVFPRHTHASRPIFLRPKHTWLGSATIKVFGAFAVLLRHIRSLSVDMTHMRPDFDDLVDTDFKTFERCPLVMKYSPIPYGTSSRGWARVH